MFLCVSVITAWECGSLIWSNTCSMRSMSPRSEFSTENGSNVSTSTSLSSTRSIARESTSMTSKILQYIYIFILYLGSFKSQFTICLYHCLMRFLSFHLDLQKLRLSLWSLRILYLKTATLRTSSQPTPSLKIAPSKTLSSTTQVSCIFTLCNMFILQHHEEKTACSLL